MSKRELLIKSEERTLGKFSANIPVDTLLRNLRLRMQEKQTWGDKKYSLGYDYRCPFSPVALESLDEASILTVSDLIETTKETLEVLPGIGTETARKAMRIIKAAGGIYRGEGFPWEFSMKVTIPDAFVEACKDAGEKDVIIIFKEELKPEVILADLAEKVRLAKIEATKADIAALNTRLKLLNKKE